MTRDDIPAFSADAIDETVGAVVTYVTLYRDSTASREVVKDILLQALATKAPKSTVAPVVAPEVAPAETPAS